MKQKLQAYLLSNEIHVEICQARRCHTRRSFHKYLLCNIILFVGRTICVAISISMMVWCDHCLLVALWFRFHIELAKCLLFGFRSSYLSEKCERHNTSENTTRENGTPYASLVYHLVVVWVAWNNYCFFVWHFAMTAMSSFWRYLFVGIVLRAWPKTWPVGIDHCSVCYCFHGNLSKYGAGLRHYLDKNLRAEKCVIMYGCNKYWSRNIEWFLRLFQKEGKSDVITWVTLLQSIRHIGRLPL